MCVLSEEPKPGRKETVWVHMRNCLHKCNRTQVRNATNEEAEGIETVTSLLSGLTEAVREGRTITDEGDPEDDEETVVEGDVMDVHLGRPDSQLEPESNAPGNPDALHTVPDRKLTQSPRPRSRLQPALIWGLEPMSAEFDFEKRALIPRDSVWTHLQSMSRRWNREGKCQDEQRPVDQRGPVRPAETSKSEPPRPSTAAASDTSTG